MNIEESEQDAHPTLRLEIYWIDGQQTILNHVKVYKIDYVDKFARVIYTEDNKDHKLIINLLSVYCILSTESVNNEKI